MTKKNIINDTVEYIPRKTKEGSKAFNRYREIDDDMKKELVNLLD